MARLSRVARKDFAKVVSDMSAVLVNFRYYCKDLTKVFTCKVLTLDTLLGVQRGRRPELSELMSQLALGFFRNASSM